ncbi:MAG: hypothetical protein U5L96_05460 [Owenweeksia sp.]|nr:hypothetical protein [Owenweeksia sp.]
MMIFAITASVSNSIVMHPDTGTVSSSSADTLTGQIPLHGLTTGTYHYTVKVTTNDPVTPIYSLPVTLHLNGIADVEVPAFCTDFDTSMAGTIWR